MAGWHSHLRNSVALSVRSPRSTSKHTSAQAEELPNEQQQFLSSQQPFTTHNNGEPATKSLLSISHASACCISIICSVVAVSTVSMESISWYLGVGNRQLVVLGFLLSIMNLCLGTVSPFTFLLLEARYGKSTLQNFSGLLRNEIFGTQLGLYWRGVLFMMLALPIALSVAYKSFNGGSSSKSFSSTSLLGTQPCYGLFAPPGLQQIESTGLTLFSNATLPFVLGTSPIAENGWKEPSLPTNGRAYGFNVLVIDENATAFVDIPEPSYVSSIQAKLAIGESWNVSATVYGTVARFNEAELPSRRPSYFLKACGSAEGGRDWLYLHLWNGQRIEFQVPFGWDAPDDTDNSSVSGDNSLMYFAIEPSDDEYYNCSVFANYAQPFRVSRQTCNVTWTFTRGGFELQDGSCYEDIIISNNTALQEMVTKTNQLLLPYFLMSPVAQLLSPFEGEGGTRTGSRWVRSYMATAAAGTFWSRATIINGAGRKYWNISGSLLQYVNTPQPGIESNYTVQELSYLYPVDDIVIYVRPALRRTIWLYVVLTVQPFLTIVLVLISTLLYSTPVSHNFGLVSILSGIDRSSLDKIAGAGLSGKLSKDTRLNIQPLTREGGLAGALEYQLSTAPQQVQRSGRLARHTMYS